MTREEAIAELNVLHERLSNPEDCENGCYSWEDGEYVEAIDMAIEALSEPKQTVYCMDCAKSAPLDEHGALWYCNAHDRTTLRHSYCNNGERKGGDDE